MNYRFIILSLTLGVGLTSCLNHKELVNFNQGPEFPAQPDSIGSLPILRIQPDDALLITIHTTEQDAVRAFELPSTATGDAPGRATSANYLVDDNGFIEMPFVGALQVAGLSVPEARDSIRARLLPFFKTPIVNIRFTQFRFTVLGEVKNPTTFTFAEEKITVLEALGMAGDLTNYADRNDILIIREENGLRSFGYVNVQSRDIFRSPYFYLRPNDVIYVKPIKHKTATVTDQFTKVLPWIGAGTAVLNLILILSQRR